MTPTILHDGRRCTMTMTSEDGKHIIASSAFDAAGNPLPESRWLHGLGHYPQGATIPPSAILSEMPTEEDVARVHAQASAQ